MRDYMVRLGRAVLCMIIILFILEKFILGFSIVKGNSMNPTLKNNDRLFINKMIYLFTEPNRGDIIIFHPPILGRENEFFIKRVIATEGDRFRIRDGSVYINDKKIEEEYINSEEYQEKKYTITSGTVPLDMLFVMGDNRNDSNDSRMFGFVPKKNIKGKADIRFWPFNIKVVFAKNKKRQIRLSAFFRCIICDLYVLQIDHNLLHQGILHLYILTYLLRMS